MCAKKKLYTLQIKKEEVDRKKVIHSKILNIQENKNEKII